MCDVRRMRVFGREAGTLVGLLTVCEIRGSINEDLNHWACSSAGRAPGLQPGGREFEPPQVHQLFILSFNHL